MRETPSLWYAYTITSEAWRPESAPHAGLPALRDLAANAGGPGGTAATTSTVTVASAAAAVKSAHAPLAHRKSFTVSAASTL